ncbi:MAG: tetratricopeptide repeat protein [Marinobacter sp.]|uniref:tetratricopeptide repeat protein n=1 Tax=Marinobacter sp. TaxID=50741 RepID=UPI00329A6362
MFTDRQGNALQGANAQSAELYGQALEAFNVYRDDPVALIDQAIAHSPDFAMARIFKAYVLGLATEPQANEEARAIVNALTARRVTEREASLLSALRLLLEGHWTKAAIVLDWHNMEYPHDLLAIQAGHLMDFYRANAQNLRDRPGRVLSRWTEGTPGYSVLLGMHAFGLEETGYYARAEETGRRAVDLEPLDCWAHHAVAHVMEMQGRAEDGVGWMITRYPHWSGDNNFFKVHNVWHQCLFYMDIGQANKALALYDRNIRGTRSTVALDLVDASALLWRLQLAGADVGGRWEELATCWDIHMEGSNYPFNDWHAAMAYAGAGRYKDLARVIASLQKLAIDGSEVALWAREYGIPLVKGFTSFEQGRYREAAEFLYPCMFISNGFGGSHAQRDIISVTLTEAALRGSLGSVAEALASGRVANRSRGVINNLFLKRAGSLSRSDLQGAFDEVDESSRPSWQVAPA